MKIIFLDIDGVLNTEVFVRACFKIGKDNDISIESILRDSFGTKFDPMACDMLKYIVDQTGAKIVISSTWRGSGLKVMQTMWEMRDLPGEVIDVTPFLNTDRGEEIAEWLRNNEVDSYVIIDDDSDMLPEQQNNFVQTHFQHGLTSFNAEKAVQILNNCITSPRQAL